MKINPCTILIYPYKLKSQSFTLKGRLLRTPVDSSGTHGLACRLSTGRRSRHDQLNDIIWRLMHRAQIPTSKEPAGLSRVDGKRLMAVKS